MNDFRSTFRLGEGNCHLIKLNGEFIGASKGIGDKCTGVGGGGGNS
jgi:hypothetical protein